MSTILKNIPTNVITGFLGVGKTTAILNLLKAKPENETWAVLVNEFGKVGIDGQLLKHEGVEIKEVPGGCMCCAAGVSMQVGINALIAKAKPDRLLIEPTGIGHPKQIIRQLLQAPFDSVLDMRACICLIDPRHLSDERYLDNEYYQEQLAAADVLLANKTDLASGSDKSAFDMLVKRLGVTTWGWGEYGSIEQSWLKMPHKKSYPKSLISLSLPESESTSTEMDAEELERGEPFRRLENHQSGIYSCGWIFANEYIFDLEQVMACLKPIAAERIKATLRSGQGDTAINIVHGESSIDRLSGPAQNRIEVIALQEQDWLELEKGLLASGHTESDIPDA